MPGLCSIQSSRNSIISSFGVTIGGIFFFFFGRLRIVPRKGHLIDMRREIEQMAEIVGEHEALYYILFSAGISHPRLLRYSYVAVVLDGDLLLYCEDCALVLGRFMVHDS